MYYRCINLFLRDYFLGWNMLEVDILKSIEKGDQLEKK